MPLVLRNEIGKPTQIHTPEGTIEVVIDNIDRTNRQGLGRIVTLRITQDGESRLEDLSIAYPVSLNDEASLELSDNQRGGGKDYIAKIIYKVPREYKIEWDKR